MVLSFKASVKLRPTQSKDRSFSKVKQKRHWKREKGTISLNLQSVSIFLVIGELTEEHWSVFFSFETHTNTDVLKIHA